MEDEDRKYSVRVKIIITVMITFIITFCLTIFLYYQYLTRQGMLINNYESSEEISDDLDELRTIIEKTYKGDINDDALKESAIKGYIAGLDDEYTEYMTSSEWDSLNSTLSDFVGIGVYLGESKITGETIVLGIISEEAPAEKAGIKPGDIIKEVNLEDVSTKGSEYISSKIKGIEGTTVKVKVQRGEEELTFDLERKSIKMYEIKSEMLENNIGYIDFDSFTETSYEEFKSAYENLKSQGAQALIVDLRNNTGGYVNSALNIADMFIEEGKTLLITEDKNNNRNIEYSKTGKVIDMPVVVIVNEHSASASEILTGILKDYKVATIIGTRTYGKGVMQSIFPGILDGALKVTTAEYFSPNENKINKIGIEPDEEIELEIDDNEALTKENDNQLKRAIEILKK